MITGTTKLLALFGDPVEKTKSPLIHNTLAELSGQDVSYMAFRVEKKEPIFRRCCAASTTWARSDST